MVRKPLYFYAPFPMGGVLLFVEIAPAVDGTEIFVEKYGENNCRQEFVSLLVS
ncbi:hypothetical protein DSOL_5169 [Desulfosporosinus metallidurans]|uniref:Uncharacterized protein n=1 Tax=Desulfosporosinus metallidurans TaxID=1888891 RepID=A0A1Q8QF10_9FIRM|nr:hypothetical protein DSOL_5169 [Desulfosporosinus metallidurans]